MENKYRWTPEDRQEKESKLTKLLTINPHVCYRELEQEIGATRPTLIKMMRKLGLEKKGVAFEPKPSLRKLSMSQEEAVVQQYVEGEDIPTIAGNFGISKQLMYDILKRAGVSLRPIRQGLQHPSWRGGKFIDKDYYVRVRITSEHPYYTMSGSSGYVLEHRLIMAEHLGRALFTHETVHHKDGDKQNNKIENLQLRTKHHGQGISLRCRMCGSIDIEALNL